MALQILPDTRQIGNVNIPTLDIGAMVESNQRIAKNRMNNRIALSEIADQKKYKSVLQNSVDPNTGKLDYDKAITSLASLGMPEYADKLIKSKSDFVTSSDEGSRREAFKKYQDMLRSGVEEQIPVDETVAPQVEQIQVNQPSQQSNIQSFEDEDGLTSAGDLYAKAQANKGQLQNRQSEFDNLSAQDSFRKVMGIDITNQPNSSTLADINQPRVEQPKTRTRPMNEIEQLQAAINSGMLDPKETMDAIKALNQYKLLDEKQSTVKSEKLTQKEAENIAYNNAFNYASANDENFRNAYNDYQSVYGNPNSTVDEITKAQRQAISALILSPNDEKLTPSQKSLMIERLKKGMEIPKESQKELIELSGNKAVEVQEQTFKGDINKEVVKTDLANLTSNKNATEKVLNDINIQLGKIDILKDRTASNYDALMRLGSRAISNEAINEADLVAQFEANAPGYYNAFKAMLSTKIKGEPSETQFNNAYQKAYKLAEITRQILSKQYKKYDSSLQGYKKELGIKTPGNNQPTQKPKVTKKWNPKTQRLE